MSRKKLQTRPVHTGEGRGRRRVAETYLEVAELIDSQDGTAINVCVGVAVLSGIAAGDAICAAALGERYAGPDHESAAELLGRVDQRLGAKLLDLVGMKGTSHYGHALLAAEDRKKALRAASALVAEARLRQP
jgi:hypothetical protein